MDLCIRHPRRRADHSLDDLVALDAALGIELHDAAQHQPVFTGAEAANAGRKLLRQHGNGTIGKVDAGSAQPRLQVEVRPRAHILGHVGNMHLQLVASVAALRHQHRIIEVPRRLAVDGDDGERSEVAAAGGFSRVKMSHAARLG